MPNQYDQAAADLFSGQLALGARASVATVADRNPDAEAQVQRKAAALGAPYESARSNPGSVDRQTAARAVDYDNLARQAPRTARFLASTSNAAIAHDDVGVLGSIEKGIRGFANQIGGLFSTDIKNAGGGMPYLRRVLHTEIGDPFEKGFGDLATGVLGAVESTEEAAEKFDVTAGLQQRLFGGTMESGLASLSRRARRSIDQRLTYQPADTMLGRGIQSGIESIPQSLGALATTIATDGVAPGLALIGASTYGQSYGQARDQGVGVGRATAKSAVDAIVEMATEYLPEKFFLGDAHAHATLGKMLLDQVKSEVPGEQVATLLQDFNQWAMIDANKGKSFDDYAAQIVPDAFQTLVATGVGLAGPLAITSIGKGVSRVARREGQAQQADDAAPNADEPAQAQTFDTAEHIETQRAAIAERLRKRREIADPVWTIAQGREPAFSAHTPSEYDLAHAAVSDAARAELAPVLDALHAIRRLPDNEAAAQLRALAEEHAQKKQTLKEQHTRAVAELTSAREVLSGFDVGTEGAREKADARAVVTERALAVAKAATALQVHALIEQQIQAHVGGLERERIEAERRARNVQRRLAQKEGAAQQALNAADHLGEINELAAASKLRERNTGPGPGSFHDLVDEMAQGSELEAVHVPAAALVAALSEIPNVAA